MSARAAKKQFKENFDRVTARSDPEKFNLYGGLYNLAAAVEDLEDQLAALKKLVAALASRTR